MSDGRSDLASPVAPPAAPRVPRPVLLVGVTGHRCLLADELPAIRAQVRAWLQQLSRLDATVPVVVLSSLAAGADQLVAQEALALGLRLRVPLPLPLHHYLKDFTAAERNELQALLARAELLDWREFEPDHATSYEGWARDLYYAQCGAYISEHSHVLIALWDGAFSPRVGGTAQVVQFHQNGVMAGLPDRYDAGSADVAFYSDNLTWHLQCARGDAVVCAEAADAPVAPSQGLADGAAEAAAGHAAAPPADRAALSARWFVGEQVQADTARQWPALLHERLRRMLEFRADALRHPAPAAVSAANCIEVLYSNADHLAVHYQQRVQLAMRIALLLAVGAALLFIAHALSPTLPALAAGAAACGGLLVALLVQARRRAWVRRYLDYRAMAESLRVQLYWRRAGVQQSATAAFALDAYLRGRTAETGWMRWLLRGADLDSPLPAAVDDEAALHGVVAEWVGSGANGGQLAYFARKVAERRRQYRSISRVVQAALLAGVILAVATVGGALPPGTAITSWSVALMQALAVSVAALEAYSYRRGDKELIRQYQFMHDIFAKARKALDLSGDPRARRGILKTLGQAALAEHAAWTLMQRARQREQGRWGF